MTSDDRPGTALQRIPSDSRPTSFMPLRPSTTQGEWQRYAEVVRHHWWPVLAVTLLGTLGGIYASRFVRPQFEARSVLWVEASDADAVGVVTGADPGVDVASMVSLLTSNSVLDSAVRSQQLYLVPQSPVGGALFRQFGVAESVVAGEYVLSVTADGARYALTSGEGDVVERGAVGDSIGRALGFRWAPPPMLLAAGATAAFDIRPPYDVTASLAKELRITPEPGARFVRLTLRGDDPAKTTATLNAITARAVLVASALKTQRLEALEDILGGRYRHAGEELRASENALAAFRMREVRRLEESGSGSFATGGADLTTLASMSVEVEELRRDRRRLGAILDEAKLATLRLDALSAVPAVVRAPQLGVAIEEAHKQQAALRALRYRYSEESAPVIEGERALAVLMGTSIPALVRTLVAELSEREAQLTPRVDAVFGRLRSAPTVAMTEARLLRELQSVEAMTSQVGARYEGNRLALMSSLPDLHILDEAVEPQTPITNLAPVVIALCFITSLGVGVFGSRVREQLDSRIRRPEQVTQNLGLTILGCVPQVRWSHLLRGPGPTGEAIESFRGLRVRVLQARTSGPLCLTITSPASGEGKSFLSANLAHSFAQAGYRTVLVDGDVRRGVQHRVLGANPRPGLVDLLAGEATLDEVIQPTRHAGLSLVSAGNRSPRAPELLMSARLDQAIAGLKVNHDIVIVDSPPLSAGVDALVLATATTNLLLVVRSGSTDLPLALAKLDVADAHPVRLIGAVLNDVKEHGAFRYYTYDLSGYPEGEEAGAKTPPQRVFSGRT